MRRYLVFFGGYYYPSGGMEDFFNDFSTIDECKWALSNKIKVNNIEECSEDNWEYVWAHIYDTEKREIIWSSGDL